MSLAYKEGEVRYDVDVLVRLDEVADVFDELRCEWQESVRVFGKADLDELGFFVTFHFRLRPNGVEVAPANRVRRVAHVFVDS